MSFLHFKSQIRDDVVHLPVVLLVQKHIVCAAALMRARQPQGATK
jgi:hypothetical protein